MLILLTSPHSFSIGFLCCIYTTMCIYIIIWLLLYYTGILNKMIVIIVMNRFRFVIAAVAAFYIPSYSSSTLYTFMYIITFVRLLLFFLLHILLLLFDYCYYCRWIALFCLCFACARDFISKLVHINLNSQSIYHKHISTLHILWFLH